MTNSKSSLKRILVRGAVAAAAVTAVAGAAIQASAGAVAQPPFTTSTTVTAKPSTLVSGEAVVFTATVKATPRAAGTPYGTVTFSVTGGGGYVGSCAGANPATLSSGTAQCSITGGLPASSSPFTVTANYADNTDTNYKVSSGTLNQTVSLGATATSVTSSSNPAVAGQPLDFDATVGIDSPATGTLTGSVTFTGVTCDGGNTVPVSGDLASCSVSAGLTADGSPYDVTASYGSDPSFSGSTSKKLVQDVDKATATIVLSATPNDCSGNVCTVSAGAAVSFTATVTSNSPSTGTPDGSVVFSVLPAGGKTKDEVPCDGGSTVPLSGVPGSDTATCNISEGLPAKVYYTVTATLSDPNYTGSSGTLYETSGQLSTDTTLSHPSGITAGETFNVTATVTAVGPPGSLAPTGDIEISVCGGNDNGDNGCQGTPEPVDPSTGQAVLTVGGGEFPGGYQVYANYLGDPNYLPSTARHSAMLIGLAPTAIAVVSSENPSNSGDGVALTAEVTATNGSAGSTLVGPPTGSVTFTITDPDDNTYSCEGGNTVTLDQGQYDEGVAQCYLPPGELNDLSLPDGDTDYTVNVSYPSDGDFGSSHTNYTQVVVRAPS
jgi:large repetitive protein